MNIGCDDIGGEIYVSAGMREDKNTSYSIGP